MSKSYIKKVGYILVILLCVGSGIIIYDRIDAASGTPGTIEDPLVSKSYVDLKHEELLGQVEAMLAEGSLTLGTTEPVIVEDIYQYIDNRLLGVDSGNGTASIGFKVIELNAGDTLTCDESTELILRAGEATAVGNASGDGLANVTLGKDIKQGENINKNHLLIVPRSDGRGIKASVKCYVMIKGTYKIN